METSEQARHHLYEQLQAALGVEAADTMMASIPPLGWGEIARRTDVDTSAALLRSDIATTRAQLERDIAELRTEVKGEIAALRTEVTGEMKDLHADLKGDIAQLASAEHRILATMREAIEKQTRVYLFFTVSVLLSFAGATIGVAQIMG